MSEEGDQSKLKVFINCRLAEPWTVPSVALAEGDLLARRETYQAELPSGALLALSSVDTQDYSLEYLTCAFGKRHEIWCLERGSIAGDLSKDFSEMYAEVDERILQRVWRLGDGRGLKVKRLTQDSQGHHTASVYAAARARPARMICYRGVPSQGGARALFRVNRATQSGVAMLYGASDLGKDFLAQLLRNAAPGAGCVHFPLGDDVHHGFDEIFFEELASERKEISWRGGQRFTSWKKKTVHGHNESLDLLVMLLILFESLRLNLDNYLPDYIPKEKGGREPVMPSGFGALSAIDPLLAAAAGDQFGALNPQQQRQAKPSIWGVQENRRGDSWRTLS